MTRSPLRSQLADQTIELPTTERPHAWFRGTMLGVAMLLGTLGAWMLIPEIIRPSLPSFPSNREEAEIIGAHRDRALIAARIGLVRGDLWSDAALTYARLAWPSENSANNAQEVATARRVAERGLSFSPHDPRLWLLLAGYLARSGQHDRMRDALKMSFYTGPYAHHLTPLRLLTAMTSKAFEDIEIQELVEAELRHVVRNKQELTPAILQAYDAAPAQAREIVDRLATTLGLDFSSLLRAKR